MLDLIHLGPTPAEEPCEQLGRDYDEEKARKECRAFISQLRRVMGREPKGATLKIKKNPHDFGTYLDVVCEYSSLYKEARDYALRCEEDMPSRWDAVALLELAGITADTLWNALRQHCCSTKPPSDAKTIVMLRREHVKKAFDSLIHRVQPSDAVELENSLDV